jgi:rod shape-determining protein MreC
LTQQGDHVHDSRRTRLVLGVLLIAALAIITIDYRGGSGSPLHGLQSVGGSVFGPVERVASDVTRPAADFLNGIGGGTSSASKVSALQRQNAQLRAELSQAQLSKADDTQLKRLLQLAGRGGYRIVSANMIAAATGYEDTVTIDAGSVDGVKPDETVLNGTGLVGRVVSVGSTTSTVLLATDASSVVGVRMAGSGQIGSVTGTGKGLSGSDLLRLELFDASAVLSPGEQVVTFGSVGGRPFVPGVPIGTVEQVQPSGNSLTKIALIRPYVDFTSLGVVGVVVVPPRVNPRDSVLPPKPAASPATSASPGTTTRRKGHR